MADEKLNTGPAENISPEAAEPITTPEQAAASEPQQEQTGPAIPESGDVVVSFDKINELMAEKRQNARAEVEKAETPETPEAAAPGETPQPANTEEPKKPRRGRPPKAEKAATENQKSEKSAGARKGRPPKADKTAPDKPKPSKRDKVSRSDGKAPDAKEPIKPAQDTALKETAAVEQTAPEPTTPPRPVEEGKLVYLKLSEVHPFHTFRPHPFKVRDDAKMQEIVASIRVNGVMVPGLARPEKDGNGYEIVAGHRRTHGSELAGLEEMPFIVREMTDHEAVQAMKDSNKQRDGMLPSELAALLELEVEDIKHQGGRLKGVAEGDVGKRSVEIVGEAHDMNYKKVMRYLRLNSLVPELLDKVDDKKMGFMPAVELSYIKPKNQRLIAVSIDGEQASPSLAQAKRLRELDKEGKLEKVFGGAVELKERVTAYEYSVAEKMGLKLEEKDRIAKYAAGLIQDEDFVYIDAGTTTGDILKFLKVTRAVFVTNAVVHAQTLAGRGFKVLLVGGELKSTTEAVIGNQAMNTIRGYHFTKGFFGTNGLTRKSGCTTPDANEAAVKAAAMEQCRECYVLCDSSKFDNISSVTFADFYRSTIITDRIPSGYEDCANIIEVQKEQK